MATSPRGTCGRAVVAPRWSCRPGPGGDATNPRGLPYEAAEAPVCASALPADSARCGPNRGPRVSGPSQSARRGAAGRPGISPPGQSPRGFVRLFPKLSPGLPWWRTPLIPARGREKQEAVCGLTASWPTKGVQDSQGYTEKPGIKKRKNPPCPVCPGGRAGRAAMKPRSQQLRPLTFSGHAVARAIFILVCLQLCLRGCSPKLCLFPRGLAMPAPTCQGCPASSVTTVAARTRCFGAETSSRKHCPTCRDHRHCQTGSLWGPTLAALFSLLPQQAHTGSNWPSRRVPLACPPHPSATWRLTLRPPSVPHHPGPFSKAATRA
ncbi:uncharacterized protein LOC129675410 [Psammomys obesus]|uniref:uncharacterized protein LOC129675410 n=1 Tax=Psammomys obesus TaxID=48139 RepID=UPI002452D896|nr:uncharacterized protein LOC129675410 [Psammomys obesus]